MDNGISNSNRIVVIDALRGFAIAAILLIHCSNNFLYSTSPAWSAPTWLTSLDENVKAVLYFILEGKAYTIFALLFGFTYALQSANQQKRGKGFMARMAWRMVLLIGFGVINAAFFSGGDPLVFYALTMFLVIPLIKLSTRTLTVLCALFMLQPLLLIDSLISFMPSVHGDYYGDLVAANTDANVLVIMYNNVVIGLKACLMWAVETGRFTQTIALFILGIIVYRERIFERSNKFFIKALLLSWSISLVLFVVKSRIDYMPITMYYNFCSSVVLMSLIVILYNKSCDLPIWKHLTTYGRMSLTNFVGQSVICCTLFYSWGFHLAAYCGATLSVAIGILVLLLQIYLSNLWLKHNKKGLLEGLWHKLTWAV